MAEQDKLAEKIRYSMIVLSREVKAIDLKKVDDDSMMELCQKLGNTVSQKMFWEKIIRSGDYCNIVFDKWLEINRLVEETEKAN